LPIHFAPAKSANGLEFFFAKTEKSFPHESLFVGIPGWDSDTKLFFKTSPKDSAGANFGENLLL
jgi:hypothetical protein